MARAAFTFHSVCLLLGILVIQTEGYYYPSTSNIYDVDIEADSCGSVNVKYGYKYFYYKASISGSVVVSDGCTADQVRVSDFFVDGSCIQQYNSDKQGCSNVNDTQASSSSKACAAVFSQSNRYQTLQTVQGGKTFDSATVCAQAYNGFFYVENNCANGSARFSILFYYDPYGTSCYSSSDWPTWASITIAVIAGAIGVGLLLCVCMRIRRRRNSQMHPPMQPQVQMGMPYNAAGPQPYPAYGATPPSYPPPQQNYGAPYASTAPVDQAGTATGYPYTPPPAGYPKV